MTLIAAVTCNDAPVLIGDVAITRADGARATPSRRKIVKLTRNCALAWTGYALAATLVFEALSQRVDPDGRLTLSQLEGLLADPVTVANLRAPQFVILIGWVVDAEGDRSFRWNSNWPTELFLVDVPVYDGNGEHYAASVLGTGRINLDRK